jgi:hypothetical protein
MSRTGIHSPYLNVTEGVWFRQMIQTLICTCNVTEGTKLTDDRTNVDERCKCPAWGASAPHGVQALSCHASTVRIRLSRGPTGRMG